MKPASADVSFMTDKLKYISYENYQLQIILVQN